jgi:hypothetical protein
MVLAAGFHLLFAIEGGLKMPQRKCDSSRSPDDRAFIASNQPTRRHYFRFVGKPEVIPLSCANFRVVGYTEVILQPRSRSNRSEPSRHLDD